MEKQWWQNRTAYQIYPKSFLDTNGDGIGDIPGIIEKLDYLKDLGIGILWISPVYVSPCADQGYDIADYYNIDPRFGDMNDFEELVEEAKKRNIDIMLDMVFNHTSTEHEWFKKALKGDKKYKDFYIFKEGKNNEPLSYSGPKEFVDICNSFNVMVNKLESSELERNKLIKDNTEEITEKIKQVLRQKSWLHRRLINAYPGLKDIKVKIKKVEQKIDERRKRKE